MSATPPPAPLRSTHWSGLRLSREGFYLLGIIGLLLTLGIGKNINLIVILGLVLLAVMAWSFLSAGRRLNRLEGRRILDDYLYAGRSVHLEVRLHNTSNRRLRGVRIEDVGASHSALWYFERIDAHARLVGTADLVLPRRGWYDFAPLAAVGAYPFGLVRRRTLIGLPTRVLVLPQPGKISRDRLRHYLRGADPRGERVHRHGWRHEAAQADFHGLRPFRVGDSPRWIHWRTSARRGQLMVREFEDVPGDDLLLVLDPAGCNAETFEDLVCLAATIVLEWNQRRGDRLMMILSGPAPELFDGTTGGEHARFLLEQLALASQPKPQERPVALLPLLTSQVPHTAAVVVVGVQDSGLTAELESGLEQPVALLDLEQARQSGLYTPP